MEIWKKIKGYDDYFVSNKGRIKSCKNKKEKILKQSSDSRGQYLLIHLSKNGCCNTKLVHRLVASAFIENPNGYEQVNHKDCNKKNNNLENLEWCTMSYNLKHAYKNGLIKVPTYKGQFGIYHNKSMACVIIFPDGNEKTFYSFAEFNRCTGADHTSVCWASKHRNLPYKFHRGKLKGCVLLSVFKPYVGKKRKETNA